MKASSELLSVAVLTLLRGGLLPFFGTTAGVVRAFDPDKTVDLPEHPTIPAPASRWLTIDEWSKFLKTESGTEFGYNDTDASSMEKARRMWNEAVQFEWGRCLLEEGLDTARKCTYVVCHSTKNVNDGAGKKMSGFERKRATFGRMPKDELPDIKYLTTIWNSDAAWCAYVQLNATAALNIDCADEAAEGAECAVTPLHVSMKMMPDTVDRLIEAIEELYGKSELTEKENGSPEQARRRRLAKEKEEEAEAEAEERRQRKLRRGLEEAEEEEEEVGEGGDATEAENQGGPDSREPPKIKELPAADFLLAPGSITEDDKQSIGIDSSAAVNDVTDYMTQWLLSKTNSASDPDVNTTVAAESIYWVSSRAKDLKENNDTTLRAQFWTDVFEVVLQSDKCDQTYQTKLNWTLRMDDHFPLLTVKYDETAGGTATHSDLDQFCVVALVASLTAHTDVVVTELRPRAVEHNVNGAWLMQSGFENRFPWFDFGLNGTGQIVAVSDTGIDENNCYFWDKGNLPSYDRWNIDTSHRKIVLYDPYINDKDYQYGHGTHVAGTIVGKKASDGITESDGSADGAARGAKVAFIDVGYQDGSLSIPNNNHLLSTGRNGLSEDDRAHIHSASWGSVQNYYTSQAKAFDDYMFNNPDFLINVAAGNSGRNDAYNTVGAPATFKNGLAVGCSHSTGYDLADGQLGPSYIADFSSKGPTLDGRMSPMIVAPGKYLLSAGAQPSQEGECDSGIPDAGGGKAGLKSMAGTSMATPLVSAQAALVQQYFREGWYPTGKKNVDHKRKPTAALVKCVLMNGAQVDMRGVDNGKGDITGVTAYDNIMGFGRLSLYNSLYLEGWSDVQAEVWDEETVWDGENKTYSVKIDRSNGCDFKDLSVSLVWVEPGSTPGCSKCVQNDLDLLVIDPNEKVYYANGRTSRDATNNAERVVVPNVADGANYTIVVEAYNLEGSLQQYALVATACFGGVPNTLNTDQDAFKTDESAKDRRNRIIIICCSVFGGLLVLCGGCWWYKKRQQRRYEEKCDAAEPGDGPKVVDVDEGDGGDKDVGVETSKNGAGGGAEEAGAGVEGPKDAMDNEDEQSA